MHFFSLIIRYLFILIWLICQSTLALALPQSNFKTKQTENGSLIEFIEGEFVLSEGLESSPSKWTRKPNPNIYDMVEQGWKVGDYHSLKGQFHFNRQDVGASPIAIYTVSTRTNFKIIVNGSEVFRNFADVSDENNPWYRPFLIPLPDTVLIAGQNEIVLEVVSKESIGIGRVILGPNKTLEAYYKSKFFWQITAPKMANFAMLLLGGLVFLFWIGRRQEIELLWLSISTVLWFIRNYQFFGAVVLFDMALFKVVPIYATYFASVASAAFYFHFIKLRHRNRLILTMFLIGIPLVFAHAFFSASDYALYIPTAVIVFYVAALGLFETKKHLNIEHGVLGVGMMATPIATIYDLYVAIKYGGDGSATYIAVFGGFFYAIVFIISFGKRALDAFRDLGQSNLILEQRVAETRAELAESEAERRALTVARALEHERGRLMQEMHDGIGSNLITSLAVAKQQNQPKSTINILNRALNDLKITVDSLEPVEGDLVALIGNLRHRMSRDLKAAGISCKWDVQKCQPLYWLDATNALHVLRIYSEAIGNVLAHSGASEMTIGCKEKTVETVPGILIYVNDNGDGFDADQAIYGKGIANMQARAKSLHGILTHSSNVNEGTIVELWLPYERGVKQNG